MATVKAAIKPVESVEVVELVEVVEPVEEMISTIGTLKVLNSSDKKVCLTSGILLPGDEGIATRAELGTLWEYLEKAEK